MGWLLPEVIPYNITMCSIISAFYSINNRTCVKDVIFCELSRLFCILLAPWCRIYWLAFTYVTWYLDISLALSRYCGRLVPVIYGFSILTSNHFLFFSISQFLSNVFSSLLFSLSPTLLDWQIIGQIFHIQLVCVIPT